MHLHSTIGQEHICGIAVININAELAQKSHMMT